MLTSDESRLKQQNFMAVRAFICSFAVSVIPFSTKANKYTGVSSNSYFVSNNL